MMSMNSDSGEMNERRYSPFFWKRPASVVPASMITAFSDRSCVSRNHR